MAMHMKEINKDEAELLIEEHLRERGWDITDFAVTRKCWRDRLDGEGADRDALAVQTVKKFKTRLGDNFNIERATGAKEDKHRDILVTTIQHLAVRKKHQNYDVDHFNLVILDECHGPILAMGTACLTIFQKAEPSFSALPPCLRLLAEKGYSPKRSFWKW
jgi:type I site-specific restriction endonuclease